jgi:hypothetical protein
MTTIKHVGEQGAIVAGAVAVFTAAVFLAQVAADAVVFMGEWMMN